ncbi:MAG: MauE/DoxX family redox-associated membrane protein [Candidatus Krumholzibacteriia bacterium]
MTDPRVTPPPGPAWAAALGLACRLGAGATFLYASLDKIADPAGFARAVFHYRLLPLALLHPFALLLPWLEAVIGVALLAGLLRRGAALLAAGLTVVFLGAIAAALARGLDISCGCFHTAGGHAVGVGLLWRDLLLLAACLAPLGLGGRDRWTVDALRARRRSARGAAND